MFVKWFQRSEEYFNEGMSIYDIYIYLFIFFFGGGQETISPPRVKSRMAGMAVGEV